MRINEDLAVSTDKILLVPYDSHHVERYHQWMQNEDLREATASDLLTLEEEYENQQSWRTAHDKLTFIVCQPAVMTLLEDADVTSIYAGEDDVEVRMVGDVNLFLTLDDYGDEGEEAENNNDSEKSERYIKGEIDIMIAAPDHRRKGCGEAAVRAFLRFLADNHRAILDEYRHGAAVASLDGASGAARDDGNLSPDGNGGMSASAGGGGTNYRLKRLVAKINADNKGSIRLFEKLGFRCDGDPNYFNEVSMVLSDFSPPTAGLAEGLGAGSTNEADCLGYTECIYDRSRLKK